MKTQERKAVKLVLDELHRRIPKSSKEGFMPTEEVLGAIKYLLQTVEEKQKK
jgi:hypothetical protein